MQVQEQEADWLETARINTDDQLMWAPEVHELHYIRMTGLLDASIM